MRSSRLGSLCFLRRFFLVGTKLAGWNRLSEELVGSVEALLLLLLLLLPEVSRPDDGGGVLLEAYLRRE